MKRSDRKKQQKALKRRKRIRKERAPKPISPRQYLHHARNYPIEGCWTQKGWEQSGLAVVVVARRQPNGNIAFGCYLVDYYCLGIKDAYCNADIPPGIFHRQYLPKMLSGSPVEISPALAHELIYGSIEYAARFGFRPHRDFDLARHILDTPETHPRSGTVEFGKNGKPFYISGPYDNPDPIIRQLIRTAGEGNFNFLIPINGLPFDDWGEEW